MSSLRGDFPWLPSRAWSPEGTLRPSQWAGDEGTSRETRGDDLDSLSGCASTSLDVPKFPTMPSTAPSPHHPR